MVSHITHERAATRAVLDAFRRIVQAIRESSRDAERRVGLSGAQLFVLQTVAEQPGLSMNDLAEATHTHQSSVSVVVSRLIRARSLERTTAASDGRRAEIRLTALGRRRLARAPHTAQGRLVAAVNGLGLRERRRLAASLELIVRRMALERQRAGMFFEGRERKARA